MHGFLALLRYPQSGIFVMIMRGKNAYIPHLLLIVVLILALGVSACNTSKKGRKYRKKCRTCPSFNEVPPQSTVNFEDIAQAQ